MRNYYADPPLSEQKFTILPEQFPEAAATLEAEYGPGAGRDGGAQFRATSYIAMSLADDPDVDVAHLNTKRLRVEDIEASGDQLGIYRIP